MLSRVYRGVALGFAFGITAALATSYVQEDSGQWWTLIFPLIALVGVIFVLVEARKTDRKSAADSSVESTATPASTGSSSTDEK